MVDDDCPECGTTCPPEESEELDEPPKDRLSQQMLAEAYAMGIEAAAKCLEDMNEGESPRLMAVKRRTKEAAEIRKMAADARSRGVPVGR